jgi:hypothetical protein
VDSHVIEQLPFTLHAIKNLPYAEPMEALTLGGIVGTYSSPHQQQVGRDCHPPGTLQIASIGAV